MATSCSNNDSGSDNELKPITLTRAEEEITTQQTNFAFRLLRAVDENVTENKEQVVVSPLSASFALSMLANGADGETRQEIINGIGFDGLSLQDVNAYSERLMDELPDLDKRTNLNIANSMWLNKGFEALPTFIQALEESYDAEVREYDFSKGTSLINEWCSDKTKGCIPKLLDKLNPEMKCLLINALYFKSEWKTPFNPKKTDKGDFHNEDGTVASADFMNKDCSMRVSVEDKFAWADIPYGNEAFSFQIILPNEGVTLDDCLDELNGDTWSTLQKQTLKTTFVNVKLPKFKMESNEDITAAIKALGIKKCFTDEAEFNNISINPLLLSFVRQANYFAIDEKGVEASSVTASGMVETATPTGYTFHVNRPFLFILKENSTNSILFMGKVTKM